jgi:hypothetical protein
MYEPSLKGCWTKIRRAEEHRDSLNEHILTTFEDTRNRATMRADLDGETGYHILSLQTVPDLSALQEKVSVCVGDIIHNLRSALDHLAWQLACAFTDGNPSQSRRIQFPIEDDPKTFKTRCGKLQDHGAWLAEIDPAHRAVIEEFQPYRGWASPSQRWFACDGHELALLRDLSNIDKHRMLTTILVPTTLFEFHVRFPWTERGPDHDLSFPIDHTFNVGAKVMRARLIEGGTIEKIEPNMDMVGHARPEISLEERGPVIPEMQRITIFVTEIIRRFEGVIHNTTSTEMG